jgi:site-specific DNA recombinase
MVWNRLRYVKNPDTGKRVSRLNLPSEWITTDVPHLRIIADELWSAANERQKQTRHAIATTGARAEQASSRRRTARAICSPD